LNRVLAVQALEGREVYLQPGNIAYKDQDMDMACLLWSRVLELNPKNELVRTILEGFRE
jgi:hypothetical protein